MTEPSPSNFDQWMTVLTFLGAMIGAATGGPLLEWIRDHIGESRRWKTQKAAIIANVRMTIGIFDAFEQIKAEALGFPPTRMAETYPTAGHEYSASAFARMRAFRTDILLEGVKHLATLHPKDSEKSAAGQRLVQYIYVLIGHIEEIKNLYENLIDITPRNSFSISQKDNKTIKAFDIEILNFKRFVEGIYASKINISSLSTIYDVEIVNNERAFQEYDLKRSLEEYATARDGWLSKHDKQKSETEPDLEQKKSAGLSNQT